MPGDVTSELRVVERAGPARRVVLRSDTPGGADLWVFGGYEGPELPAAVSAAGVEALDEGRFRIAGTAAPIVFRARAADRIAVRPSLFDALHRTFTLGMRDRIAARALLALLRLPGGARLLRSWHARRSR